MKVKLNKVRLSFPDIFEPVQFEAGKGPLNYRATFLMEPNSENHKGLLSATETIAKEEWKDKYKQVLDNAADDSKLRFLVDGNKKAYDGYAGMIAVSALRGQEKGRPLLLDKKPKKDDGSDNVLTQADGKPYAGCYVNATLELWPQSNKWGRTIRAQLLAIQFHSDGDAFGAGSAKGSADEFEDLSETGSEDLVA